MRGIIKKLSELTINQVLIIGGAIAFIFIVAFFVWWQKGGGIEINNNGDSDTISNLPKSLITGLGCEGAENRPIAVMLASDPITRPLSGISQADIVFEMPVTPSGLTRIMAVYQCESPDEIGSVRSAREDFIPLAASLGTVFAHWGGETEALEKLDGHIIDNIDAMRYETVYFYRKSGIPQPHNGFTDFERLEKATKDLKYDQKNTFTGYPRSNQDSPKNILNLADTISINYEPPFNISWLYKKDENTYARIRGGSPETDKNNGVQALASVVIVMKTTSRPISKDYQSVIAIGKGNADIYQNGVRISGQWSKDPSRLDSKLFFYDTNGKEIEFTPGKIWVEIVTE
ncbi:MAG: hypothetical protein A3B91_00545 [Candidatus Yanofskybacteria bacterium RIFCSPHIGHO2_02_FULL_41_29]|uniref:DUF3048 domain-containing protein n=1 Tax=Candidatus Yanofskybacteria bacterium RIFCSPHIGHO2_01_FULL_41_53 TaxID=1802663 RepID=A0A1F8EJD0_9BACT|nr:MAG: hypothetical protein A2650_03330 [Candidatus Yanofskybacteria bacterium RIFCSPHIGHO2_01_FULL_41_53]OGN12161.1 MAG: hypothetical protein A3B91_00545 [Candidatus Yanofskybacteria bacterium RIFCSPHIGHO2_02_FULL_41_29]OGN17961.1 MAG: hypothetical protein A3F48_04635 [Candidatus Yanofskybacteria bacterium RIFCSPHIGHO2_12_FULL_41_9]OGN23662.1 MAG: hypothetical protein A2916_03640 [Candidatus Yanofskybacteria bacterium RIFCSPLOWO2_01_FULL_41_67]OGN29220.1 MAG: hypothetical protein A3H54_03525 